MSHAQETAAGGRLSPHSAAVGSRTLASPHLQGSTETATDAAVRDLVQLLARIVRRICAHTTAAAETGEDGEQA
jgi:hypothetical protein